MQPDHNSPNPEQQSLQPNFSPPQPPPEQVGYLSSTPTQPASTSQAPQTVYGESSSSPQAIYAPSQNGTPSPAQPAPHNDEQKDFVMAFLLSWLLGIFGADRFYLGYTG